MKNKKIGLVLMGFYGLGAALQFIRQLSWEGIIMKPAHWVGTIIMIGLFVGAFYFLIKEDQHD